MFAACTTSPEGSGATLSEYRTFAVAPLSNQGPAMDPEAASRLNETIQKAIQEALIGKGYTETGPGEADFIVKLETAFSPDPILESSERRYLIIGFHDRTSDVLIWSNKRGRSSSRTLEPELLHKSIIQMLSGLPPAPLQK
jgi:hypothetical protein